MATSSPAHARSGRIIALLLVTLGVAGAIGWEANRAAAAERQTAEAVLRDYASFAAWEFARAGTQQIEASIDGTIAKLSCAASTHGIEAALAAREGKPCECGASAATLRTFFQRDPDGGWRFGGVPMPEETRRMVAAAAGDRRTARPEMRVMTVDGRPSVVAWAAAHDGRSSARVLRGYVADAASLQPQLAGVMQAATLLPETLLARDRATKLLHVRVADASGRVLFATAGGPSAFSGRADIGSAGSGITAFVSLAPEAASQLIIGGMPRTRLPWLYGLLVVAAALVIVAVVQLRREAELGRLRANFISGVSHELRTPLAQIRMFAETLLLGRVRSDDEARRSLEIVLREAHRLSQLADNVLCFERGGRGVMTVDRREVDARTLLGEIAEGLEPFARTRGASIRLDVPADLRLDADPAALRQIVLNLIDNALKYGPPGQTVTLGAGVSSGGARLWVDDEGPGVPERDRSRVWNAFWRGSGSAAGGSGIGLSIVQQLTALHGGRAWVETAASGGARFVVTLPAPAGVTAATVAAGPMPRTA